MTQEALKLALEALDSINSPLHVREIYKVGWAMKAIKEALAQPEQEPVAWIHNFIDGGISIGKRPIDLDRHPDRWTGLYKKPKPCPTCQSLARSVMLDQTSHDTTPPQRKPLTDEEIMEKFNQATGAVWISDFARSIEAAHGIKE